MADIPRYVQVKIVHPVNKGDLLYLTSTGKYNGVVSNIPDEFSRVVGIAIDDKTMQVFGFNDAAFIAARFKLESERISSLRLRLEKLHNHLQSGGYWHTYKD